MYIAKWSIRIVIGIVVIFLLGIVGGVTYQAVAVARAQSLYPPPGELVDVGGYKLHIYCEGEGSSTLVVDAGSGTWSLMWLDVLPQLAERTRTCVYDRAGYGLERIER